MGINMSHSVLLYKKPSYKVSEYAFDTKTEAYSRSHMMQKLHEFNHSIREVRKYLKEEVIDNPIIDKNIVPIYNRFQSVVDQTAMAIKFLKDTTAVAIESANLQITNILGVEKDPIEDKYSLFERGRIIASTTGYAVPSYRDLNITSELLDPKFPDVAILSNSKLYETLNLLCNSQSSRDTEANEAKANQLIADLQDIKSLMIDEVFRNYTQYSESILGSSVILANKVFGKVNVIEGDVPLTDALYSQACDNIVKIKEAQTNLDIMLTDYTREYNLIDTQFQTILKNINEFMGKNDVLTKNDDKYAGIKRVIAIAFENGLNTISALVTINFTLLIYKLNRLVSIAENCQDIRSMGNYVIKKSLGLAESCQDYKYNGSIFNGLNVLQKLNNEQEALTTSLIMLEEMFESDQMNEYGVLFEADANNINQKKNTILKWIEKVWEQIKRIYQTLEQKAIDERDVRFWQANAEKLVKNTDITTVQVSDWTPYNLDVFSEVADNVNKISITECYNKPSSDIDEAMITKIFPNSSKLIGTNDKDKPFADKIGKMFNGGEVIKDNVKLGDASTNFNKDKVYNFITMYVNKDNNVRKGKKYILAVQNRIDSENKEINAKYAEWASKYQKTQPEVPPQAGQQPAKENPTETPSQDSANDTGASSEKPAEKSFLYPTGQIVEEFDLAAVLGLSTSLNENIEIPQTVAQNVRVVTGSSHAETTAETKPLDDAIHTYLRNLSSIYSTLTNSLEKAYRQYTALYKEIYKSATQSANSAPQAQQNQNPQ